MTRVFVDTSAWVALFLPRDVHHEKAKAAFKELKQQAVLFMTSSAVVDETATVLSCKDSQEKAILFLDFIKDVETVFFTKEIQQKTHGFFKKQKDKGISMVDCSNIIFMKMRDAKILFTFDTWFKKYAEMQVKP